MKFNEYIEYVKETCLEIGEEKGFQKGEQSGFQKGEQSGFQKGEQSGFQKGEQKGKKEGKEQALQEKVCRLCQKCIRQSSCRPHIKYCWMGVYPKFDLIFENSWS